MNPGGPFNVEILAAAVLLYVLNIGFSGPSYFTSKLLLSICIILLELSLEITQFVNFSWLAILHNKLLMQAIIYEETRGEVTRTLSTNHLATSGRYNIFSNWIFNRPGVAGAVL